MAGKQQSSHISFVSGARGFLSLFITSQESGAGPLLFAALLSKCKGKGKAALLSLRTRGAKLN
ncbi:hypothetical protein FRX31_029275 [Thalictrum thalictroides]|uniref:Uncharacterized protein n=1 Tax=Thalictrum thalictroides TaxID=46969 RepID=A0A7J6V7P5_THATH|nr:hypothetical protein FRX31_029275 [Thalictrum thalictroides]